LFNFNLYKNIRFSIIPSNDHSRRLIQTAYACFQQLNECNDLNDEQKQCIQTWMDAVTNVRDSQKDSICMGEIIFCLKENSEDFYNDLYTCRITNLENALHSVCLNR
jgi:hypothetical protein